MITPSVIVAMMRMSLIEGDSRRKRKAKQRTNAKEEDLHIAGKVWVSEEHAVGIGEILL